MECRKECMRTNGRRRRRRRRKASKYGRHTNRPHMSLATREASGSCAEPSIQASILKIPAGQVSEKPRRSRTKTQV